MLFLLLASPWFIFADLLLLAAIIGLTENNHGTAAGAVLLAAFIGASFFTGWGSLVWIVTNPGTVALLIGAYGVVGILWSILKWFFYTRKDETQKVIRTLHATYKADAAAHAKSEASINRSNPNYVVEEYQDFDAWLKSNSYQNPLDPSKNKIRITRWMIWWPTSFLWTLLSDLIVNIANFVYDKIAVIFTSILNAQIKRALKDVENN